MRTPSGASWAALLAFTLSFTILISNGRPIGSGDTNAMEQTVEALLERGTFVLQETDPTDPFTRPAPGGRVSIYPALPALLAAPVFLLCRLFFDLTPVGLQVAGKLSAALFAAAAASLLARSFARRTSAGVALVCALTFCLATSVYSTAQALWQHPAAVLFLVIAIDALDRREIARPTERGQPALIAAFSLSLAAASRPAAIPLCAVLFGFLIMRARPQALRLIAAALLPAAAVASYNSTFFGAPWQFGPAQAGARFFSALPESIAGLLVSPARGLIVFTPIAGLALFGLVRKSRTSPLARALLAASATHFAFMATWNEWHGGESFGPRLLTESLPALFFFLPEAFAAWPVIGGALALGSFGVQLLGGITYDYRWERLHQRGHEFDAALWSWADSPLAFAVREGVLIQGVPELQGSRVRLPLRRSVPFGTPGSMIEGSPRGLKISGPPLLGDIRLERGARSSAGGMTLSHPGDALAFRVGPRGAHSLHLEGSLRGTLRIETPLGATATPFTGDFDLTLPVELAPRADISVRAESGQLQLLRVEVR